MKRILHPTDFSPNASRAFQLAHALAQKLEAELIVVHIGEVPALLNRGGRRSTGEMEEARKATLKERLQAYCKEHIMGAPAAGISCEVRLNRSTNQGLLDVLKDLQPSLVVMGARGQSWLRDLVLGSTTCHLIEHAPCPVLSVPLHASPTGVFRRIVYASGYDPDDRAVVNALARFAAPYEAGITVLHVFSQPAGNESARTTFEGKLRRKVSYPHLQFATRVAKHANGAISAYVQEQSADLLVMYEREHSGILGLFHRDKVQHQVLHTTVPLLSYNRSALATHHLKTLPVS